MPRFTAEDGYDAADLEKLNAEFDAVVGREVEEGADLNAQPFKGQADAIATRVEQDFLNARRMAPPLPDEPQAQVQQTQQTQAVPAPAPLPPLEFEQV